MLNRILILGISALGILLTLFSASTAWFEVPSSVTGPPSPEATHWQALRPAAQSLYHGMAILTVALTGWAWLRRSRWFARRTVLDIQVACGWLLLLLVFPFTVIVCDLQLSARAHWMQMQFENLLWLGGDVNTSAEFVEFQQKTHVLVVDPIRRVEVVTMPTPGTGDSVIRRLPQVAEWLGFKNAFCQFVRKGWFAAFAGGACLLLASLFGRRKMYVRRLDTAIVCLLIGGLAIVVFCLVRPIAARHYLHKAEQHSNLGEFRDAAFCLEQARQLFPILGEDTWFVAQSGLLDHLNGVNSRSARLHLAIQLDRRGEKEQALERVWQLLETTPSQSPVWREAYRYLVRLAVDAQNAGRIEESARLFEAALRLEPCDIKANYGLQVACLQLGDTQRIGELVDQMYETCRFFRFPNKKVLLAASQQNALVAHALAGNTAETRMRLQKILSP